MDAAHRELNILEPNKSTDKTSCRFVLVTGPSGAGRSTAIKVLEDLGFEAIDNLPLRLLPTLLNSPAADRPMALGVDTRNRDFSSSAVLEAIDNLTSHPSLSPEVLYLDCSREVLLRRFSETRRRHPMAPAESPDAGIDREFDLLGSIRSRASILIETTDLNVHQLRAEVERWFGPKGLGKLAVSIHSFSYKRGLPRSVDTVFDCRFLTNPYWVPALRRMNGLDRQVADHVAADPKFAPFFDKVLDMTEMLLPAYSDEGKAHFSIGFGCTGGQHRSVTVAERLAQALAEQSWQVSIRHRELERRTVEGKKQA
jgi:UPF0042 nucleotide-binding protein